MCDVGYYLYLYLLIHFQVENSIQLWLNEFFWLERNGKFLDSSTYVERISALLEAYDNMVPKKQSDLRYALCTHTDLRYCYLILAYVKY